MTRRGLHLPSRRAVVATALVIFFLMTVTHVGWAMKMGLAAHAPGIGTSILLSVACLLVIAGLIDLLHRLEGAGWSFEEPRPSRWFAFYGVWLVVGLGIGAGRVAVLQARSGMPLTPERAAFVVFVCLYMTMLMLWALENQAMFQAAIARKQESSRRAASFLFRSRKAFVEARDRRRHEALDLLERQVEPELAAIQERVLRLQAEGRSGRASETLVERLEHLRLVEIRQVSHLLHPSIIDMGLAPALRALVRNRSDDLPIRLEIDDPILADLLPETSLQLYRIAEHALDWSRSQAVREIRISLARAEGESLRLEVAVHGQAPDREPVMESGDMALLDARVALLGGEWTMEPEQAGWVVLRVRHS